MKNKKLITGLIIALVGVGGVYYLTNQKPSSEIGNLPVKSLSSTTPNQPKVPQYQKKILELLEIGKERDKDTQLLIEETVKYLKSVQPVKYKIASVKELLTDYQDIEGTYEEGVYNVVKTENYKQLEKLVEEGEIGEKEQVQLEKSKGFAPARWLTDREIDGALEQLPTNLKYKILPAYQFYYVNESKGEGLGFPQLLNDLADEQAEFIFIPVNNPDFHGSLLVYETANKSFWHYDSLKGANDYYVKPLVKDIIMQLWQINSGEFDAMEGKEYFKTNYKVKQGNGSDCGVAVIEICRRIMELGKCFGANNKQEFDFGKARLEWWEKLNNENE